ncbi:hypothetical protein LA345_13430 [Burkholderia vietnamiensis]|uniref:Uncharacterized protein n=1 Tax=Burkholderia vietnamiensis (strain G4 / LMG 22486) TaxID=269482 RepID=A4JFV8_BURVG|nr:hypothetical protein Bcep1808_2159 [Burkholderia vietnamiensis G4]MCB4344915.1 hypothetical protein [Burkholderia vietnamiensis]
MSTVSMRHRARRLRVASFAIAIALLAPAAFAQSATMPAPSPNVAEEAGAHAPPLARVGIEDAMACAPYLREGVMATPAEINYRFEDARGARRDATIEVCRQWRGSLTKSEASSIREAIRTQHPEQRNVVLRGVAAQN